MLDQPRLRFLPLFLVALAVRVGVVILGAWLGSPVSPEQRPSDPTAHRLLDRAAANAPIVEPWYRWDALWMVNVATHGYAEAGNSDGRLGVAFLPALPAVMAGGAAIGWNMFWLGVILPNLAAAAGTAIFARVAQTLTGSRDAGIRAFVLLLAFPTSFFYSAPYNEAFGLLFTSLALAAWQSGKVKSAGVAALFGSFARMTGIALGAAAIGAWILEPPRSRRRLRDAVILAAGSFAGLVLFWLFLWWAVGDFFAGAKSQAAWGRAGPSLLNPWRAIVGALDPAMPRYGDLAAVLGCGVLGVRAWLKRGAFWGILTLIPLAQMLATGTLLSGIRIVLACLPAFIELADVLKSRAWFVGVVVAFVAYQVVLLNQYVRWVFAG